MKQYMDAIVKPAAGVVWNCGRFPFPSPRLAKFLSRFTKPPSAVLMFIFISGMTGLPST